MNEQGKKTLIEELKGELYKFNSNFRLDSLSWSTRVALQTLCEILDRRLEKIETEKKTDL